MQDDPLTPVQHELLEALKSIQAVDGFYLAGGSGLALQLGHRQSLDHDLFRRKTFLPSELQASLVHAFGNVVPRQMEKGTLTVEIREAKVSFFEYDYPLVEPLREPGGLFPTADLVDIGLMKLTAIMDRGLRKDFFDLFHILRTGIRLHDLLSRVPQKFPGANLQRYHFVKALTYFEDAHDEPLKIIDNSSTWEEIQNFFRQEIAGLPT